MTRMSKTETLPVEVELAGVTDPYAGQKWLQSLLPRRATNVAVWSQETDPGKHSFLIEFDWEPPTMPEKLRHRATRRKA